MLQLVWPWMLAAVAAPMVVARAVPRAPDIAGAPIRVPYFEEALAWSSRPAVSRLRLRRAVALLAWCALVLAAARPQWVGDPVPLPVRGRDLMLALDLSGSMREQDMKSAAGFEARIDVVKRVAGDFVARRTGDRIGLVLFGTRAYLQAPFTLDLGTVSEMIAETVLGLAGEQTAIGDAIGLAVKRLRDRPMERRVLVLLTDGADTASEVDPLAAARFAADEGITIYAVGVGADEEVAARWLGARRMRARSALDESTLRTIADMTGGRYFRARDTAELEEIYRLIDVLEPTGGDDEVFRPTRELFHWPLGFSALLFTLTALIGANASRNRAAYGPLGAPLHPHRPDRGLTVPRDVRRSRGRGRGPPMTGSTNGRSRRPVPPGLRCGGFVPGGRKRPATGDGTAEGAG